MRIGIDLGGTKTEGILIDNAGESFASIRRPTPASQGYSAIIDNVAAIARELDALAGGPCRIGIGTPGSVDPRNGRLRNSNTVCLNGMPFARDISERLGREIRIANDANCFTLSEAIDGAAAGARVVFGVIMGTGVGGGIVIDGRLVDGRNRIAGEWGHNVLLPDGPPCYCGRRGCVETLLSGPGLVANYDRRMVSGGMDARAIVEAAATGDLLAAKVVEAFLVNFGRSLATVVNILDPDIIVLGGGLSNIDALYTRGLEHVKTHVFSPHWDTRLVRNRFGDSSGVRGAAWLWPARNP